MSRTDSPARPDPFAGPGSAEDIRAGAARNFALTTFANGGVMALRLITYLALARLLAPSDFGVLAMVVSTFQVAELFRDMGLTAATVRLPTITPAQVNSLFWINAAAGLLVTVAGAGLSPLLAGFFGDPRVAGVALAMSCTFVLNGLAAQHMALLRRNLRFADLARISIAATSLSSAVALVLAMLDFTYWSLVCGTLAANLLSLANAWRLSGWRPGRPAWDPSIRPMLSFGGHAVAFGFLSYLAHNLHLLLIGRFWGAASVGLYTRATGLLNGPVNLVLNPLRLIAPATLTRLGASAAGYRDYYLGTVALLVVGLAPASIWAAVLAPDVVAVLLGARWAETAELLRWLALSAVPQMICSTTGWLFMSRGDSRAMLNWGLLGWSIIIACLLIGLRWGINGAAMMYTVAMYLNVTLCLSRACRGTAVAPRDLWRITWRPALGAVAAGAVVVALMPQLADWHALARLIAGSAVFAALYLALMMTVLGERVRILGLWSHMRTLLRARAVPPGAPA